MPAGRPLELTSAIIAEAKAFLPRALYVETVAGHLGVHRNTFIRWMREGAREQRRRESGKEPLAKLDLHCELSCTIKKTLADAEADYLSVIQAAGADAWTALAWILERRFPGRWSQNRAELRALKKQVDAILKGQSGAVNHPKNAPGDDEGGASPSVPDVK